MVSLRPSSTCVICTLFPTLLTEIVFPPPQGLVIKLRDLIMFIAFSLLLKDVTIKIIATHCRTWGRVREDIHCFDTYTLYPGPGPMYPTCKNQPTQAQWHHHSECSPAQRNTVIKDTRQTAPVHRPPQDKTPNIALSVAYHRVIAQGNSDPGLRTDTTCTGMRSPSTG